MSDLVHAALRVHLRLTPEQVMAIRAPCGIRWRMLPCYPAKSAIAEAGRLHIEFVCLHLVPSLMVWN